VHVPALHVPTLHRHRSAARSSATPGPAQGERGVRAGRGVTALVAVATGLFGALWTLTAFGYADASWWPVVVILAISAVAALGAWLTYWIDR